MMAYFIYNKLKISSKKFFVMSEKSDEFSCIQKSHKPTPLGVGNIQRLFDFSMITAIVIKVAWFLEFIAF